MGSCPITLLHNKMCDYDEDKKRPFNTMLNIFVQSDKNTNYTSLKKIYYSFVSVIIIFDIYCLTIRR
jgi:hypothetical protein